MSKAASVHVARARFHASLTLILAVVAVLAGLAWLVLKAFVCWSSRSGEIEQQLCEYAFVLPDAFLLCAGATFVTMLWALLREGSGGKPMHAVRHAYHGLENDHRRRVKGASIAWVVGVALFVGAAGWYLFELPPLAGLVGATLLASGAYLLGKYFARPT